MLHIKSFLPKVLKKRGIEKQIEAVEICKIADEILKEAFGNNNAKALFFRNSTLRINCLNSTLANEIQFRREKIKDEINEEVGKKMIKDILIRVG